MFNSLTVFNYKQNGLSFLEHIKIKTTIPIYTYAWAYESASYTMIY